MASPILARYAPCGRSGRSCDYRRRDSGAAECTSGLSPKPRATTVYLGDDLFSHQPMCEAVLAEGSHFLFVRKPSSHPLIQE